MRIGTFTVAAGIVGLTLAAWYAPKAQAQMYDTVNVNLPYTVTIGEKTLQPGEYKIQQLQDLGGGSNVLLIYSDNGMKFETNAMTIPALDNNTPNDTKVILHHFGNDYYFDKIWIQGKDYGYEFPLPKGVKEREKEGQRAATMNATYVQNPTTAQAATPPPETATPTLQSASSNRYRSRE